MAIGKTDFARGTVAIGRCFNEIALNAPINTVWKRIKDFHDMSWAEDVVTSLQVIGDKSGDEIGAKRVLNEVFFETPTELNSQQFTFSYTIDDGPGTIAASSISNYVGTVKLSATDSGTRVKWSSLCVSRSTTRINEFGARRG